MCQTCWDLNGVQQKNMTTNANLLDDFTEDELLAVQEKMCAKKVSQTMISGLIRSAIISQ
jgi:hypothetical protein